MFLLERETNELVAKVFDGDIRNTKEVRTVNIYTLYIYTVNVL